MRRLALMVAALLVATGFSVSHVHPARASANLTCGSEVSTVEWAAYPTVQGANPHAIVSYLSAFCTFNSDGSYFVNFALDAYDDSGADAMIGMAANLRTWDCSGHYANFTGQVAFNQSSRIAVFVETSPVYYRPGCDIQADNAGTFLWAAYDWWYIPPYVNQNSTCVYNCARLY